MSIVIKGNIGIGYCGANHKYEYTLEDLGYTEQEWLKLSKTEKDEFLDSVLENELSNVLDAAFWVEGEEDWVNPYYCPDCPKRLICTT